MVIIMISKFFDFLLKLLFVGWVINFGYVLYNAIRRIFF